jgi:hypothetical protein
MQQIIRLAPSQTPASSHDSCDQVQGYLFSPPMPLELWRPLMQELNQRKPVITDALSNQVSDDENTDMDHISPPWSIHRKTIHRVKD